VSRYPTSNIIVVDTDVVSFLYKGDTRGDFYRSHLEGRLAIISAQTRAELELWALARNWSRRRKDALRVHLKNFVMDSVDEAVCLRWAAVVDGAKRRGRPISNADAWVAATALAYGVPLVTHNASDFVAVAGLKVISER
jgi:predicted nucleic acid-binding protein